MRVFMPAFPLPRNIDDTMSCTATGTPLKDTCAKRIKISRADVHPTKGTFRNKPDTALSM